MFRYCVNLILFWNILVSPSMVIESFAGYSSLGWHLCSLRLSKISSQDLLAFIVSVEKSGVILIGLPLYITCSVFLNAFSIFSLFQTFGVLTTMCLEKYLFWSNLCWSSVGFLYDCGPLFFKVRKVLFYNFVEDIDCAS